MDRERQLSMMGVGPWQVIPRPSGEVLQNSSTEPKARTSVEVVISQSGTDSHCKDFTQMSVFELEDRASHEGSYEVALG